MIRFEVRFVISLFLMTKLRTIGAIDLLGGSLIGKSGKSYEEGLLVEKVLLNLEFGGMRNMAF